MALKCTAPGAAGQRNPQTTIAAPATPRDPLTHACVTTPETRSPDQLATIGVPVEHRRQSERRRYDFTGESQNRRAARVVALRVPAAVHASDSVDEVELPRKQAATKRRSGRGSSTPPKHPRERPSLGASAFREREARKRSVASKALMSVDFRLSAHLGRSDEPSPSAPPNARGRCHRCLVPRLVAWRISSPWQR
jgi:hypothetical protein